ncbi:hypothetical protein FSB65_21455 [Paraburkholderia sp. JPY418]|nr:hypothetical protein [Paraburkholderia youngii]
MNVRIVDNLRELTPSYREALLECARFRPGTYVYKPRTMEKIRGMGLTYQAQGNAYCLTRQGADLVRAWKERIRK